MDLHHSTVPNFVEKLKIGNYFVRHVADSKKKWCLFFDQALSLHQFSPRSEKVGLENITVSITSRDLNHKKGLSTVTI
jgi:hypothetical protein